MGGRAEVIEKNVVSADALPVSIALENKAATIRQKELNKCFSKLADMSEGDRAIVVGLTVAITEGILRAPLTRLNGDGGRSYEAIVREIFALEDAATADKAVGTMSV